MAIGTPDALMQNAEGLMRTEGYSGFSYAALAKAVGISKPSIHHHFPAKEDSAPPSSNPIPNGFEATSIGLIGE